MNNLENSIFRLSGEVKCRHYAFSLKYLHFQRSDILQNLENAKFLQKKHIFDEKSHLDARKPPKVHIVKHESPT